MVAHLLVSGVVLAPARGLERRGVRCGEPAAAAAAPAAAGSSALQSVSSGASGGSGAGWNSGAASGSVAMGSVFGGRAAEAGVALAARTGLPSGVPWMARSVSLLRPHALHSSLGPAGGCSGTEHDQSAAACCRNMLQRHQRHDEAHGDNALP